MLPTLALVWAAGTLAATVASELPPGNGSQTEKESRALGVVLTGSNSTDGDRWSGLEIFDSVQARYSTWGLVNVSLTNFPVTVFEESDVDAVCSDTLDSTKSRYKDSIVILPEKIADRFNCLPYTSSDYVDELCRRVSRSLIVERKDRPFASYGYMRPRRSPIFPDCFHLEGRLPESGSVAMEDLASLPFGSARANLTSEPNYWADALDDPFVLLLLCYATGSLYLFTALRAGLYTVAAFSDMSAKASQTTRFTRNVCKVVLLNNFLTCLALFVYSVTDAFGCLNPGLTLGWTGFFRMHLAGQVPAMDLLLLMAWKQVVNLFKTDFYVVPDMNIYIILPCSFVVILGVAVDIINADMGLDPSLLLALPFANSIIQCAISVMLWKRANEVATLLSKVIDNEVSNSFQKNGSKMAFDNRSGKQIETVVVSEAVVRNIAVLQKLTWAARMSSLASFVQVGTMVFATRLYFSSPSTFVCLHVIFALARASNAYAQVTFCASSGHFQRRPALWRNRLILPTGF